MKKINYLLWAFVFALTTACTKEDVNTVELTDIEEMSFTKMTEGNNPYSVGNMQLAYQYLVQQGRLNPELFPGFHIRTTHKYLKLTPATLEEEDQILADTTYIALDYPLDLDLPEDYSENRPELGEDEIPEYYTSVRSEKVLSFSGAIQLLDDMYIPEEDPYFEDADEEFPAGSEFITSKSQLFEELLFTAYFLKGLDYLLEDSEGEAKGTLIDGNEPQKPVVSNIDNTFILDNDSQERFDDAIIIKPLGIGKKWWPSGTIYYTDTSLPADNTRPSGLEFSRPLPGGQVLLRQGFTMRSAITNSNGYFSTSSIRGKGRYILQWERAKYNIKNKGLWQAEMRGPYNRNPWNHTIQATHGEDVYHSLIHLACLDFYYGTRFGIVQPKNNIRIAARQISGTASNHVPQRSLFYSIAINEWGSTHDRIYGTTIHELGHSSHHQLNFLAYSSLVDRGYLGIFNSTSDRRDAKRLLETWATTIELMFVQKRYSLTPDTPAPTDQILTDKHRQLLQNITIGNNNGQQKEYTSCGFDMIDNHNQGDHLTTNVPFDRVRGYTLLQLEQSIGTATTWNSWRDNIKSQHTNSTSQFVDELFANWN